MTRPGVKASLVALSLATTLGIWAALARNDNRPASVAPDAIVQTLDLPAIPTLVRPPATGGTGAGQPQTGAGPDLPPIPAVSAPVPIPQPIARTRSSR